MLRIIVGLFALALVALAGCSNSIVPPEELVEASASYQIAIDASNLDWGGYPPYVDPALGGLEARLDLSLEDDGTVVAYISPAFGIPAEYRGTFEGAELTLIPTDRRAVLGDASFASVVLRGEVQEGIVRVAGDYHASGSVNVAEGDVLWMGSLEADGTIRPDDVVPELRLRRETFLPALAPWSPVRVELSEPVAVDEVLDALSVSAEYEMDMETTFDGLVTAVELQPAGWWPDASISFALAAGVADLSGNEAAAASEEMSRFASPSALSMIDFDSPETSDVDAWGLAEGEPAMECASGAGCLVMYSDGFAAMGLYGRLEGEVSTLAFRARAREAGEASYGRFELTVTAEVGGADGGPVHSVTEVLEGTADVGELADSGWVDFELPLPETLSSPGVAINIVSPGGVSGGWAVPSPQVYVAVDDLHGL